MPTLTGILNLNKPQGMTSRQAVTIVNAILKKAGYDRKVKVGHCGTLDPLATGVLVVCIGKATRLVPLIQEQKKVYRGVFQLGRVTSTDDFTGETLSETSLDGHKDFESEIQSLLPEFTGQIEQVPPKFSAVHVNGRRAYELARKGKEVKLEAKTVQVHRLELQKFELPDFDLLIECGSGTYIRSLGRDIGERLGCGATMKSLVRTQTGGFSIEQAVAPDSLNPENIQEFVQSPLTALDAFPTVPIDDAQKQWIFNGRSIKPKSVRAKRDQADESRVALVTANETLVALATYNHRDQTAKPDIVFHEDR